MSKQKQKEPLSLMIAKTVLVIAIVTGIGTIIFGGGVVIMKYYSGEVNNRVVKTVDQEAENYYDVLEKKYKNKCCINKNSDCCLYSISKMRNNGYKERDGECPEGFKSNGTVRCPCLMWCEPISIEKDDTSNWKTYRNEEFGFEFQYPKDWENVSPSHLVISQNQMVEILIFPNKELSLEQWVEKFFQKNCEKIIIGNNDSAIKCLSDDQFSVDAFLSLEDVKILSISCLKISDNQQDCTDKIDQILSSFKFIEKS